MAKTFLLYFSVAQNSVTIINTSGGVYLLENPEGYVAYSKAAEVTVSTCDCLLVSTKETRCPVYINWGSSSPTSITIE